MALEHFILYIIVFLYGIIIGSFLNVCIYRMPKGESVVTVGSHCMNCKHPLKWYDLFPVFSYLALRGKCRYCGAKISIQYPLVELANGILYVLVVAICGLNPDSILWCVLTSIMIVIAVTDLKTMKFPTVCEILMIVYSFMRHSGCITSQALCLWEYFYLCAHFCLKRLREKQDLVWATLNSWRVLGCVSDLDILYWH